jgi:hypothetical protein
MVSERAAHRSGGSLTHAYAHPTATAQMLAANVVRSLGGLSYDWSLPVPPGRPYDLPTMRKTLLFALTAALVLASATQASAALRILKINYKSPRPAGEYVLIKNKGTKAVAMKGWTLRDIDDHVYRFPNFSLPPGKAVTVHAGKGRSDSNTLYWGRSHPVWDAHGDTAILRRKDGSFSSKCSYPGGWPGYTLCPGY